MTFDMHMKEARTLVRGADGSLYIVGTGKSAVRRVPDEVSPSLEGKTYGSSQSAFADALSVAQFIEPGLDASGSAQFIEPGLDASGSAQFIEPGLDAASSAQFIEPGALPPAA